MMKLKKIQLLISICDKCRPKLSVFVLLRDNDAQSCDNRDTRNSRNTFSSGFGIVLVV